MCVGSICHSSFTNRSMKKISIIPVDNSVLKTSLISTWAQLYCKIWLEAPWCEDFWKPEEVVKDFRTEMSRQHAVGFLALEDDVVIGFTHGYSVDKAELRVIAGNTLLDSLVDDRVFYIDELGVGSEYRGLGVSLQLSTHLLDAVVLAEIKTVLLRTDKNALVARGLYQRLGFEELSVHDSEYPDRTYWRLDMSLYCFMKQFTFDRSKTLHIGVEQECFLANKKGEIKPYAVHVLRKLKAAVTGHGYTYAHELSACQLEYRIGPSPLEGLLDQLLLAEGDLIKVITKSRFRRIHSEVGPTDMSLAISPDPSGRYEKIAKRLPKAVLSDACRIIGTHIHIGMPDHATALKVYNRVIKKLRRLCNLGDGSAGKRMRMYQHVSKGCRVKRYERWREFHHDARVQGFEFDPRSCWSLIRISRHGTIEFRMFGATSSIEQVAYWANVCHDLCLKAMY